MTAITVVKDKWWVLLLGIGLAIVPIHNQLLTALATVRGEVLVFIPAVGFTLLFAGSLFFVYRHWTRLKAVGMGEKSLLIPLLVIVGAIALSGVTADTWTGALAPAAMGIGLLALYMTSRLLGQRVFIPLAIGAVVAAIGIIASQIAGQTTWPSLFWDFGGTGGLVFEKNYAMATWYILIGAILCPHKARWLILLLGCVALSLSGSAEFAWACGIGAVVMGFRRDWSKKLLLAVGGITLVAVVFVGIGTGTQTWGRMLTAISEVVGIPDGIMPEVTDGYLPVAGRLAVIKEAMTNIQPLGEGYGPLEVHHNTVHNVPLVIIQQLGWPGVVAALAWLWVSIYCLVKTRFKYAWVLVLALGVWNHFTWTQFAPLWWMLVGVSTTATIEHDRLWRPSVHGTIIRR